MLHKRKFFNGHLYRDIEASSGIGLGSAVDVGGYKLRRIIFPHPRQCIFVVEHFFLK